MTSHIYGRNTIAVL